MVPVCYCWSALRERPFPGGIPNGVRAREQTGTAEGRREPFLPGEWSQEVIEMNWFVDVFDRESVRRETLRCANECSLTLIRQINEMSNR